MQIILVVKKLELCHFEFNVATYITQRCSKLKKKKNEGNRMQPMIGFDNDFSA